jgi:hypothetical protein
MVNKTQIHQSDQRKPNHFGGKKMSNHKIANNPDLWTVSAISLSLLLALPAPTSAADIEAEFRAGYGRSDNIARLEEDEQIDESIQTIGLSLDVLQETRKFEFVLRSNFDYLVYADETFDDEVVGGLMTAATYWFIPERFNWYIQNNWGQQVFDPFATTDPGNREDFNYLTTGPSLLLPVGTRNMIGLDLRASRVNYETRVFDNDRQMVRAYFDRAIRDDSNMSFNVRVRSVEFESGSTADDYDLNEVFIRYERETARDTVSVDAGVAEVEDENGEKNDGYLFEAQWARNVSSATTVTYYGGSSISDGVDMFRDIQDSTEDIGETIDINGFEDPFRNNYIGFRYDVRGERNRAVVEVAWNQEDYVVDPGQIGLDRDVGELELRFSRALTRDFFIDARVRYMTRDYKYIDRRDDDAVATLVFGYNFTPSFNTTIEGQYIDRDSTEVEDSFIEVRTFLRFTYIPSWGVPAQ